MRVIDSTNEQILYWRVNAHTTHSSELHLPPPQQTGLEYASSYNGFSRTELLAVAI